MSQQERGRFARRSLAAIGVAALALFGSVAASTSAAASDLGNLPTGDGALTIHKYEQPSPAGPAGDGSAISVPGNWVPIGGVTFTIQRISDVNLSTNAGWDLASAYAANPASIPSGSLVDADPASVTTGTAAPNLGVATATLPIGAYLITETAGPATITGKAAPFVVTVPIPNPSDGTWNSDVHVYPKNSVVTVNKTVTSPGSYGLGSTVTWPITVKVPTLAPGQDFTNFIVEDTLDSRLQYESYTLTLDGAPVAGASVTEPSTTTPGGTITAKLVETAGGTVAPDLNALLKANAGKDLVLTITTKVVGLGEIVNDLANVKINDVTIETPEPVTRWGDLVIKKTDQTAAANPLSGAKFQVYSDACVIVDGAVDLSGKTPIQVTSGGTTTDTFTTGAGGLATVAGLWIGDTSAPANDVTERAYCVVETEAPAGFNILAPGAWTVNVQHGATQGVDLTVADPKKPPVQLPLTGSTGTALFVAGGMALILTAGAVSFVAMRRRAAGAAAAV